MKLKNIKYYLGKLSEIKKQQTLTNEIHRLAKGEENHLRVWPLVGFPCSSGQPHTHAYRAALMEINRLNEKLKEIMLEAQ